MGIYNEVKSVRRRKMYDPAICSLCGAGCSNPPCYPLTWIDGDKPRKENFISQHMLEYPRPDYKEVLGDLAETQEEHDEYSRFQQAVLITDERNRMICLGLLGRISQRRIGELMHISRTQLGRLIHAMISDK